MSSRADVVASRFREASYKAQQKELIERLAREAVGPRLESLAASIVRDVLNKDTDGSLRGVAMHDAYDDNEFVKALTSELKGTLPKELANWITGELDSQK